MAHLDTPTAALQALSLSEPEHLLFRPSLDMAWLEEKFNDIPRYLFRVYSGKSRGITNRSWTKSMGAKYAKENSQTDIFARRDHEKVASMLYRHLKWIEDDEDNLGSWTSSLLFALVYIFHLHASCRDGSTFDEIFLCIIDTTTLPKRVFLRDMDLLNAYFPFKSDLAGFRDFRSRGEWYFGEYLSQGALKIEDKSKIVSAQSMINRGLFNVLEEFEDFSHWDRTWRPPWAKPVVDLRQLPSQNYTCEELQVEMKAAIDVAKLFGAPWALPVAANLIALLPFKETLPIVQAFRINTFNDEKKNTSPSKTKVMPYDGLPEVERFGSILKGIYQDFCATKLIDHIKEAELQLRHALVFALNNDLDLGDSGRQAVKGRLDIEAFVNHRLRERFESGET